jgi:fructose/tagatose bisphosphate aldolase
VPVEGELGEIGVGSFTNINQINEYIKKTGVDYLALALGSAHGVQEGEHLNLDLLAKINKITDIPLVLHGGSGVPDNDVKQAIQKGICKINIDTDLSIAFTKGITEGLKDKKDDYREILTISEQEVEQVVAEKIKLFGSANV